MEIQDWSLANEIFLCRYRKAGLGPLRADLFRLVVFPRKLIPLSEVSGLQGTPTVAPEGKRLAVRLGPDEEKGLPYSIVLLDLEDHSVRTFFERFGTRMVVYENRSTVEATRVRWSLQGDRVFFVDPDHAVEGPPQLIGIDAVTGGN